MADSIRDLFFGTPANELVEAIEPRRTFDDVVLPETTLRQLNHALALVRKHDLIFRQWGLAERHSSGLGLAFHFAGPPGTGKTICAEALAYALDQRLLVVRYAELESRWVGQTAKHVASVFRAAERQNAVLFFDEADAIAGRRFTSLSAAYEREERCGEAGCARAHGTPPTSIAPSTCTARPGSVMVSREPDIETSSPWQALAEQVSIGAWGGAAGRRGSRCSVRRSSRTRSTEARPRARRRARRGKRRRTRRPRASA